MAGMSIFRPPKPGRSLADRSPDVAAQWHPTRNGELIPAQMSAGTDAKAWWRCEQGHEWEATVDSRTSQGLGCPVCSGRKLLTGYNDLATRFPDIAAQWHPTRNADLVPAQVSKGSGKRCGGAARKATSGRRRLTDVPVKALVAPSVPGGR